jgi:predicted metalloprotease with PDZ domain
VLRRAGLFTPSRYLEEAAKIAKMVAETPGRRSLSLEELSQVAWVDFYLPYEETANQSVSYYQKGYLVSLALDLEIRHRTENRASLDSVLRLLWTEYGKVGKGVGEGDLQPVAERASGLSLTEFFDRYVRGTDELDLNRFAGYAGLSFGAKPRAPDDESPIPGYLGLRHTDLGGFLRVTQVLLDTPAHRAGVSPGDEIVAVNGNKVTASTFVKSLEGFPPGTPLDLTVFRRGYLRQIPVTTGAPPPDKYRFAPLDEPAEAAKRVYQGWLAAPWEPAKSPAPVTPK